MPCFLQDIQQASSYFQRWEAIYPDKTGNKIVPLRREIFIHFAFPSARKGGKCIILQWVGKHMDLQESAGKVEGRAGRIGRVPT
jgi:hypothetical protein